MGGGGGFDSSTVKERLTVHFFKKILTSTKLLSVQIDILISNGVIQEISIKLKVMCLS